MDGLRLSYDGKELEWACDNISQVEIPNGVTTIGKFVFSNNTSLNSVVIPKSVTKICEGAFSGCTSLKTIDIPNSVIEIGDGAFQDCSSLENIGIPNSVKKIGAFAFFNTKWLTNQPNGLIYLYNALFFHVGGVKENPLIIKNGTTSIVGGAFFRCTSLKSIVIPNSVKEIGIGAFNFCTSLESIDLPNTITEICLGTFSGCTSLKTIDIPNSVTTIGASAFANCSSLNGIDIPNSVTSIGGSAFNGCYSLKSLDIPNSVTEIGGSAFSGCYSLQQLIIPSSIKYIGDCALYGCRICNIVVDEENPIYFSNNNVLYKRIEGGKNILVKYAPRKDGDRFIVDDSTVGLEGCAFMDAKQLIRISLHDNVTDLGLKQTFAGCSSLKAMQLPPQIEVIPFEAFAHCHSLENVYFPNSDNYRIEPSIFKGCKSLKSVHSASRDIDKVIIHREAFDGFNLDDCTLYVPAGTRWAYRHHKGFGMFKNIEIENNY